MECNADRPRYPGWGQPGLSKATQLSRRIEPTLTPSPGRDRRGCSSCCGSPICVCASSSSCGGHDPAISTARPHCCCCCCCLTRMTCCWSGPGAPGGGAILIWRVCPPPLRWPSYFPSRRNPLLALLAGVLQQQGERSACGRMGEGGLAMRRSRGGTVGACGPIILFHDAGGWRGGPQRQGSWASHGHNGMGGRGFQTLLRGHPCGISTAKRAETMSRCGCQPQRPRCSKENQAPRVSVAWTVIHQHIQRTALHSATRWHDTGSRNRRRAPGLCTMPVDSPPMRRAATTRCAATAASDMG